MAGFVRAPAPNICNTTQTHEMNIPNDLIGCIIGRGGTKINEIRQLSGANIKISGSEEGLNDRIITVTGLPESINAAVYLINASLEMHKNLALTSSIDASTSNISGQSPCGLAIEAGTQTNSLALTPYCPSSYSECTPSQQVTTLQSMPSFGALNQVSLSAYNQAIVAASMGLNISNNSNTPVSQITQMHAAYAAAPCTAMAYTQLNGNPLALPPIITSTALTSLRATAFSPVLNTGGFNGTGGSFCATGSSPIAIPYAPSMMKPIPMMTYQGLTYFDPTNMTKVKSGLTLSAANRYSPY